MIRSLSCVMGPTAAPSAAPVTPAIAQAIADRMADPDTAPPDRLAPVLGVSPDVSRAAGPDPVLPDAPAAVGGCGIFAAFVLLLVLASRK